MSNFLKKIIVFLGIIALLSATFSIISPASTFAENDLKRIDGSSCEPLLGLTNWDCGVSEMNNETQLVNNIAVIATNILTDLTVIAAYLVLGYVIYGGYLYMFSSGDPGKAAAGKKTLQHAFIGLAITMSAYAIFGAIRIALVGNSVELSQCAEEGGCVTGDVMITNLIQWVLGMAGAVAAIFVVVGGWGYITASGDPNKLQKAKTTILYALIGLAIVALAEILTAFISNLIKDANGETSFVQTTEVINLNKENIK